MKKENKINEETDGLEIIVDNNTIATKRLIRILEQSLLSDVIKLVAMVVLIALVVLCLVKTDRLEKTIAQAAVNEETQLAGKEDAEPAVVTIEAPAKTTQAASTPEEIATFIVEELSEDENDKTPDSGADETADQAAAGNEINRAAVYSEADKAAEENETDKAAADQAENIEEEKYYDSLELLAVCVEAEAGNQSLTGRRYVADVILNRVDDPNWPDTVEGVITQKGQFSSYTDGGMASVKEPSETTYEAVRLELDSRLNYDIFFFRTGHYTQYGVDMFKEGEHYFSGQKS